MTIAIIICVVAVLCIAGVARYLHSNPPRELPDEEFETRLRAALRGIDEVYPDEPGVSALHRVPRSRPSPDQPGHRGRGRDDQPGAPFGPAA